MEGEAFPTCKRSASTTGLDSRSEKVTNHAGGITKPSGSFTESTTASANRILADTMSKQKEVTTAPVSHNTVVHPTRRPFGVVEILENILSQLSTDNTEENVILLLKLREVSPWWEAVIKASVRLRQILFLRPESALALPPAPTTAVIYSERRTVVEGVGVMGVLLRRPGLRFTDMSVGLIYAKGKVKLLAAPWPPELPRFVAINPLALQWNRDQGLKATQGTRMKLISRWDQLSATVFTITLNFFDRTCSSGANVSGYTGPWLSEMLIAQPPPSRMSLLCRVYENDESGSHYASTIDETELACAGVTLKDLATRLRELYKKHTPLVELLAEEVRPGWVRIRNVKIVMEYDRTNG